jgi:hypothetical protein
MKFILATGTTFSATLRRYLPARRVADIIRSIQTVLDADAKSEG